MSGIRYQPRFTVFQTSPETKKIVQSFSRRDKIRVCCLIRPQIPIFKKKILDGGIPFSPGPNIKNGGSPLSGGPKVYSGGNPSI
jgi:hypothetical protein